jgi:CRP-like cAMP-binding protein
VNFTIGHDVVRAVTAKDLVSASATIQPVIAITAVKQVIAAATLDEVVATLAEQAEIRTYRAGELITEVGDTCRELLLLIEGAAQVKRQAGDRLWQEEMRPGQVLDELEVLTHSAAPCVLAGAEMGNGWMGAVLEGLYGAWLGGQPGTDPSLAPRRVANIRDVSRRHEISA